MLEAFTRPAAVVALAGDPVVSKTPTRDIPDPGAVSKSVALECDISVVLIPEPQAMRPEMSTTVDTPLFGVSIVNAGSEQLTIYGLLEHRIGELDRLFMYSRFVRLSRHETWTIQISIYGYSCFRAGEDQLRVWYMHLHSLVCWCRPQCASEGI